MLLPNDPVRATPFQNITLLLGKAVIWNQISNSASPDSSESLVDLLHALCIDWKTYASVTVSVAEYSALPRSLDVLVGQLANTLVRIVETLDVPADNVPQGTSWEQDYSDLRLLRHRLANEFGSLWLERVQLQDTSPDNFPEINTSGITPSLSEYRRRFRSSPFAVPAEFLQNDWVALAGPEGLQHLEVLAAELGHEWSRAVRHRGSSELVLLVRLWRGLMALWSTISTEAKTPERTELLSFIFKCHRALAGALVRWSSKGTIKVALYGPHMSGKTTTLNALIGRSALSTMCEFASIIMLFTP
jgi:hypothetical protein